MTKRAILIIFLALFATTPLAHPVDIDLKWEPSAGATGYKIQLSLDQGETWPIGIDVGNVTASTYTGAPEDKLLLFRVLAYNEREQAIRTWSGAWYDHRKKPITSPTGAGIY